MVDTLTFLSGPREGETIQLAGTQILGRSARTDICIDDASVSREHARLSRSADGWMLVDLGSSNGSSIDGARVTRGAVASGAVISVGIVHMKLHCALPVAAQPATRADANEIRAVGRSAGSGLITSKAAREQSGGEDFTQLSGARKAVLVLIAIALCAGLFYGAYLLV